MIQPFWQFNLNLMGRAQDDPKVLTGEIMNQDEMLAFGREQNESLVLWIRVYCAELAYRLGDFDAAEAHSSGRLAEMLEWGYGGNEMASILFFDIMILLAQVHEGKRRRLTAARRRYRLLRKWALHSPDNMLGKQFLVEGEIASVQKKHLLAISKYTSAIVHSRDEGRLSQEALANERLGKLYVELGDDEAASRCLQCALRLYEEWGGIIKVEHLRAEMAEML